MNNMDDLSQDIALIKKDLAYIRKELDDNLTNFRDHVKTSHDYRNRVLVMESDVNINERSLAAHIVQDHWVQGLIFTAQIAVLTKMIGVW